MRARRRRLRPRRRSLDGGGAVEGRRTTPTHLGITSPPAHRRQFLSTPSSSPPDRAHHRRNLAMSTYRQEHASGREELEYSSLLRDLHPTQDPRSRRFLAVAPSSAEMAWRREAGAYSSWSATFRPDIYLGSTMQLKKSRQQTRCGKNPPPPSENPQSFCSVIIKISKKLTTEVVRMAGLLVQLTEYMGTRPEMERVRLELQNVLRTTALNICYAIVSATDDPSSVIGSTMQLKNPPPPPESSCLCAQRSLNYQRSWRRRW